MARKTGPPTREQMLLVQSIYERHRGLIYAIATERARDEQESDDIVSEALMRLFRNAHKLDRLHEKQLVDYLADTLRSVAGDFERKHKTERRHFLSLDEPLPDLSADFETGILERAETETRLRHLEETLAELSETDRLLLTGKYVEGASDEELARQLGVKSSSIRMKLTRARKRARSIMERKEAGEHA